MWRLRDAEDLADQRVNSENLTPRACERASAAVRFPKAATGHRERGMGKAAKPQLSTFSGCGTRALFGRVSLNTTAYRVEQRRAQQRLMTNGRLTCPRVRRSDDWYAAPNRTRLVTGSSATVLNRRRP